MIIQLNQIMENSKMRDVRFFVPTECPLWRRNVSVQRTVGVPQLLPYWHRMEPQPHFQSIQLPCILWNNWWSLSEVPGQRLVWRCDVFIETSYPTNYVISKGRNACLIISSLYAKFIFLDKWSQINKIEMRLEEYTHRHHL